VIDEKRSRERRHVGGAAAFGVGEHSDLPYGTSFHVRIDRRGDEPVALVLLGELDITSMVQFERAVAEVMSQDPPGLLFDVTASTFVSAQGFDLIGRCSATRQVEVWCSTDLPARVFAAFGHTDVVCVTRPEAALNPAG
jgi:anti-anti-sigma regulatory factor